MVEQGADNGTTSSKEPDSPPRPTPPTPTSGSSWSLQDIVHYSMTITVGIAIGLGLGMRGGWFSSTTEELMEPVRNVTNATKIPIYKSAYGVYRHAAVASDHKICSDIGRDIMALHGGNAIDSSIATSFCSGVLHPQSTGVGGGLFAVVYHKKRGMHAIISREAAPLAATWDMFSKPGFKSKSVLGGLSICVPGFVRGLMEMHERFGTLPWKTLVMPSVRLLREGFPLTAQTYQGIIRQLSPAVERMKGFEMFLDEDNDIKPLGTIIRIPKLANTLERIAEDPVSFHNGSLAQDIVADIQEAGGIITEEDLHKCQALVKEPTRLDLPGDKTLYSVPAPAAGPTLSYILSILSGYKMTPADMGTIKAKVKTYHRLVEALKFTYARKSRLGDEDFEDVAELVKNFTSRAYGEETRSMIDDSTTHGIHYYGPKFYNSKSHGTSHTSVIDPEGNAVAITSSINLYFGSQVVGSRTGIFFNDEMADFSHPFLEKYYHLKPSEANFVQPGKRPLSSMCPSIVWDNAKNKISIIAGAAGGHKIQAALALNLMNLMWFNMSVPQAIDAPRLLHELLPNNVQAESHFTQTLRSGLKQKGHKFLRPIGITVVQMIQVLEDALVAGSDFRKKGEPSGF